MIPEECSKCKWNAHRFNEITGKWVDIYCDDAIGCTFPYPNFRDNGSCMNYKEKDKT